MYQREYQQPNCLICHEKLQSIYLLPMPTMVIICCLVIKTWQKLRKKKKMLFIHLTSRQPHKFGSRKRLLLFAKLHAHTAKNKSRLSEAEEALRSHETPNFFYQPGPWEGLKIRGVGRGKQYCGGLLPGWKRVN